MCRQASLELTDAVLSFRGHRNRCSTYRSHAVDPGKRMHSDPPGCPSDPG